MTARPVAVLDANVLIPPGLRDVLLSCADVEVFRPVWQSTIEEEVLRNGPRVLVQGRGLAQPQALEATQHALAQMNRAFPDARLPVQAWKPQVAKMTNEAKDRHVLAAAVGANASHVVTLNMRDFPVSSRPAGIHVCRPDTFLLNMLDATPELVLQALARQAARLKTPAMTPADVATQLANGSYANRFGAAALQALQSHPGLPRATCSGSRRRQR